MRRVTSILLALTMTGMLLVVAVPTAVLAANTFTSLHAKPKAVKDTGYKMSFDAATTGVTIDLKRRYGQNELEQQHRYAFNASMLQASKDLSRGKVNTDTQMGAFGEVVMKFRATKPTKVTKTCGGEIITKKRTGVLKGIFKLRPDTQGNDFFKRIKFRKLKAIIERVKYKDCQNFTFPCPKNEVALFAGDARAGKTTSGAVSVQVHVFENTAPANFINHFIAARVKDPTKMSYDDDLSMAQANFSVAAPYLSGTLNYSAGGPPAPVQDGECGKDKTWSSDASDGTVMGSVTAHFDSYGDVTISPATGVLQRWATI